MKGNPQVKNSTLRTEINGNTEYSKIFDALENSYRSQLTTVLNNKRTTQTANIKQRDTDIFNTLFDAEDGTYTQAEGLLIK